MPKTDNLTIHDCKVMLDFLKAAQDNATMRMETADYTTGAHRPISERVMAEVRELGIAYYNTHPDTKEKDEEELDDAMSTYWMGIYVLENVVVDLGLNIMCRTLDLTNLSLATVDGSPVSHS